MRLWDKLLPQTITTLNLLQQLNAVPAISAYQYVRGNFDYNKTLLAPLGCAVQMHKSQDRHGTWAQHSINGWYLGTSPEHYRSYIIHTKGKQSERISDTVFFKTKFITQPTLTPADSIDKAIAYLTNVLKGMRNKERIQEIEQLKQLDNILNNIPQTITEMPPPLHQTTEDNPITESRVTNTPAPETRVENNAEALTPNTSPTPEPPIPRPGNDKESRNRTRELLCTILQQSKTNRARIIQQHQMQLRRSDYGTSTTNTRQGHRRIAYLPPTTT
jgi:hypothetical protein